MSVISHKKALLGAFGFIVLCYAAFLIHIGNELLGPARPTLTAPYGGWAPFFLLGSGLTGWYGYYYARERAPLGATAICFFFCIVFAFIAGTQS